MNISLTGTRYTEKKHDKEVYRTLSGFIKQFKPENMYFGGARGIDTISLLISKAIVTKLNFSTKLIVVFPNTKHQAPMDAAHAAVTYADEIVELENEITKENGYSSYRTRNEYLVDHCELLIGFPHKRHKVRSGTWMCINYAQKIGKEVVIHELD